jgi:RNA polymerase sigma-70 factor, ECF subfamily
VLRVDQGLAWAEIAEILAGEGRRVEPAALMKRFERLKERLARMARDQGLLE